MGKFGSLFWIANSLELFERFAFYGAKAVLAYYLAHTVKLDLTTAASLAGMYSFLVYSLPIVAGVFVDRYGFRKTLAACFTIFTAGYFLIGAAALPAGAAMVEALGKVGYCTAVLVFTAVGGSLIKPCIVGTVERTSPPSLRSLGFSVYYTLVNFGGAVGPVLAAQIRGGIGIEYVFLVSALTSALLLGGTLLFFREPPARAGESGAPQRGFGELLGDMLLVFRDLRFITILLIFSGFYIMFWQTFYSFPFYVDEVLHFRQFEVLESVDAWSIILLSVPLSALAKRMTAIQAMTAGLAISSCSWLVIAGWATVPGAILTFFLFAAGEAILAPRFYDYVGTIAPPNQLGTFMGFAFLPVAIGSLIAGRMAGWLVETFMRARQQPWMMWLIVGAIGAVSTVMVVIYDRVVGRKAAAGGA